MCGKPLNTRAADGAAARESHDLRHNPVGSPANIDRLGSGTLGKMCAASGSRMPVVYILECKRTGLSCPSDTGRV